MSVYNACACVPSFSKGGAGVVCDIHRTHVIICMFIEYDVCSHCIFIVHPKIRMNSTITVCGLKAQ